VWGSEAPKLDAGVRPPQLAKWCAFISQNALTKWFQRVNPPPQNVNFSQTTFQIQPKQKQVWDFAVPPFIEPIASQVRFPLPNPLSSDEHQKWCGED